MKSKKKIQYWGTQEMINHAKQVYDIEEFFESDANYRERLYRQLVRMLQDYGYKAAVSDTDKKKEYRVPEDIAKLIVEHLLLDYLLPEGTEKRKKYEEKQETHHKKVLKKMENISLRIDEEMCQEQEALRMIYHLAEMAGHPEYDPDGKILAEWQESLQRSPYFHKLSNGRFIEKRSLEYHIPHLMEDEISNDIVDKIVDRTMLRAIFDIFYDFDEKGFREALYERAAHVFDTSSGNIQPIQGYSEISRQVERPLGTYLSPKKNEL